MLNAWDLSALIFTVDDLEKMIATIGEPFMPQIYHIKLFTPSIKSNRFPCVNFAPIKARPRLTQILQAWEKEQFQKIQKKARLIEQLSF